MDKLTVSDRYICVIVNTFRITNLYSNKIQIVFVFLLVFAFISL